MKIKLAGIIVLFIASSCNRENKELKQRIANADSVAINYFKGDGTMDTVVAVKIVRDKQKIDQLVTMIAERSTNNDSNCGYDGSLHFFKKNVVVQDIDFRINQPACMNFSFMRYGKKENTVASKKVAELLHSIQNEK